MKIGGYIMNTKTYTFGKTVKSVEDAEQILRNLVHQGNFDRFFTPLGISKEKIAYQDLMCAEACLLGIC